MLSSGLHSGCAFDPCRWVAPAQFAKWPFPCICGFSEASCEILCTTNDKSIVIGKSCDSGHRWICCKTISDCVEALIGAYYVGGVLPAATAAMKWLGIDVEMEPELVEKSMTSISFISKRDDIKILESKLGYKFSDKGLLLEVIMHFSQQEMGASYQVLKI